MATIEGLARFRGRRAAPPPAPANTASDVEIGEQTSLLTTDNDDVCVCVRTEYNGNDPLIQRAECGYGIRIGARTVPEEKI